MKEVFEANSIAVVGASPNPGKIGYTLVESMKVHGFKGGIFPVNPKYQEILGLECFPSIASIPEKIDLVFFALAANKVLDTLGDCQKKGVKALVIISAGFAEASKAGSELESNLLEESKKSKLRLLGPNTTGFVFASRSLVASINHFDLWLQGNLAIGGQTGIFAGAYMDEIMNRRTQKLGYELSVSLGNKTDFDESDFVEYAGSLNNVRVIQLYLESIKNSERFFKVVEQAHKPVVLLRGGTTAMGRQSTRAHTGSVGLDRSFRYEDLTTHGIVTSNDIEEFFDIAKGFSYQPLPSGRRVGVATMSGANGTLAADAASELNLEFPAYSQRTIETFRRFVSPDQTLGNPADIGFAMTTGEEVRKSSMQAILDDPNVDSLLMIDLAVQNSDYDAVRPAFEELEPHGKPVYVVLQGGKTKEKWLSEIEGLNIPVYPTPRRALKVAQAMFYFSNFLGKNSKREESINSTQD